MKKEETISELMEQLNQVEVQGVIKLCPMLTVQQLKELGNAVLNELKKR